MQLLLLSNSTNKGEPFLSHPANHIQSFLGTKKIDLLFVPFAAVTISYEEYEEKVSDVFSSWGYNLRSIHREKSMKASIGSADGIIVGGGNTHQLLSKLIEYDLLNELKYSVINNNTPYIGWSAGSNIVCPSIKTTNDMPIVSLPHMNALGLVPFQLNPHFTLQNFEHYAGENREARLLEYIELNQDDQVLGLPEGNMIRVQNRDIEIIGTKLSRYYKFGKDPVDINSGSDVNFLMK